MTQGLPNLAPKQVEDVSASGQSCPEVAEKMSQTNGKPVDPFLVSPKELVPVIRLLRQVRTGERVPVTLRVTSLRKSVNLVLAVVPFETKREELYGIEYDDPSQGKHEGVLENGDLRFTPRQKGKNACSFLLSPKDLRRGYTFAEALAERYDIDIPGVSRVFKAGRAGGPDGENGIVLGSSGGSIVVEVPGIYEVQKRFSALGRLQSVGLEEYDVYKLGGDESTRMLLRERLTSLTALNLSNNLIYYWADLAEIVACMPSLRKLVLNNSRIEEANRRGSRAACNGSIQRVFEEIREVELCNCLMTWTDVMHIAPFFPNLERLDLVDNAELAAPHTAPPQDSLPLFSQLRYLNLAGCGVRDWAQTMASLPSFPKLETLDLSDTPTSSIPAPRKSASVALPTLILRKSNVTSWASIDALSQWTGTSLTSLKFSIYEMASAATIASGADTRASDLIISGDQARDRPILIAKLPGLTSLNSTPVTPSERRDAEVEYVRMVDRLINSKSGKSAEWGRYDELRQLHGMFEDGSAAERIFKPGPLKSNLISLNIHKVGVGIESENPPVQIAVLPTIPVTLLRKKISRALELNPAASAAVRIWTAKAGQGQLDDVGSHAPTPIKAVEVLDGDTAGWWFSEGDAVIVEIVVDRG